MSNVNVQAMEKFVSRIQRDPARARKHKGVTGSWVFEEGKPQFVSTIGYAQGSAALSAELSPFCRGLGHQPRSSAALPLWTGSLLRC